MSIVEPGMESMLEAFLHETDTMLEQLDEILLDSERAKSISDENINSIFRITHTIKGSAAMMGFEVISSLAHSVEDIFYILREDPSALNLVFDTIFDLVFQSSDFLKKELEKIQEGDYNDGDPAAIIQGLKQQAKVLKGEEAPAGGETPSTATNADVAAAEADGDCCKIQVFFEDDCQMENMRAFMLITQLQQVCDHVTSIPENPENNGALAEEIAKNGVIILCKPASAMEEIGKVIESALNIKSYEILQEEEPALLEKTVEVSEVPSVGSQEDSVAKPVAPLAAEKAAAPKSGGAKQSLISVNQSKLDHLMDLVGEIVTAESMVVRNPDLQGLRLDNFTKSFRELRKLTDELQDIVMSIRMVPLQGTFNKMDRIVRDMSKKLNKQVTLVTEGGDTEVDKTINDAMADPFMHMIRNSVDHAIETPEERRALGKPEMGTIRMSARHVGGEIVIDISDDGCGLDTEKLLAKGRKNGLLTKPEEAYTDKEIFGLIMLPGFSTNQQVTEFSGRGVGMDVVRKNIEQVGGTISINSAKNQGTTFTIKIPLTLAIVDGMNILVGKTVFTLPIASINQSFKIYDPTQIIQNTNGTEMIMLRGDCYPVYRLNDIFGIPSACTNVTDGIMIQVESSDVNACIFADDLLGEYQVVVKPFPAFFNKYDLKKQGLSGCSVLGDGSVSLILDTNNLLAE